VTPYAKGGWSASVERVAKVLFITRSGTREGPDTPKDTRARSFTLRPRCYRGQAPMIYVEGATPIFLCPVSGSV